MIWRILSNLWWRWWKIKVEANWRAENWSKALIQRLSKILRRWLKKEKMNKKTPNVEKQMKERRQKKQQLLIILTKNSPLKNPQINFINLSDMPSTSRKVRILICDFRIKSSVLKIISILIACFIIDHHLSGLNINMTALEICF